jgi:hypothetical protein
MWETGHWPVTPLAGRLSLPGASMRKNGRKRPIRVLKMRARRRGPAGFSEIKPFFDIWL